jgi:hypothetical protein
VRLGVLKKRKRERERERSTRREEVEVASLAVLVSSRAISRTSRRF